MLCIDKAEQEIEGHRPEKDIQKNGLKEAEGPEEEYGREKTDGCQKTRKKFEIIVVDDGSKDSTCKIAQKISKKVRTISLERNRRQTQRRLQTRDPTRQQRWAAPSH